MGVIEILCGLLVLAILWLVWAMKRTKVVAMTQFHFACMVDALEDGDLDKAVFSGRMFNEMTNDAMNRLDFAELVKRMYVKKEDAVRMIKVSELPDEDLLLLQVEAVR